MRAHWGKNETGKRGLEIQETRDRQKGIPKERNRLVGQKKLKK